MELAAVIASVVFSSLAASIGAYTAVKVRLAVHDARITAVESTAERAHVRIDELLRAPPA